MHGFDLHGRLFMQISKHMIRAYFHWKYQQTLSAQALPENMDYFDFKDKLVEHKVSCDMQTDFSHISRLEEFYLNQNIRLVFPEDMGYPLNLRVRTDEPPILSVHGQIPSDLKFMTIVGCRNPSVESLKWMRLELPLLFRKGSATIVSGAARGIDQEAHEIALACQCPTLAFLPCGIEFIYPESFLRLRQAVIDHGGAIISGFAPWKKMHKSFFHRRNQWMVDISDQVLVVEAQRGGGSWLTGSLALKQGREVASIPVHPLSCWGLGNNDLLFHPDVKLVRDANDLSWLLFSTA